MRMTNNRICEICGKPVYSGMTDGEGNFYTHDGECFEKYMDETYGKHKWMSVDEDGEGGYYIYSDNNVAGGYLGTGIYYTEWDDGVEDICKSIIDGAEVVVISDDEHRDVTTMVYWNNKGKYYGFNKSLGVDELTEMNDWKFNDLMKSYIALGLYVFVRG